MKIRTFSSGGLGVSLAIAFSSLSIILTLVLVKVIDVEATEKIHSSLGHNLAELAYQTTDKLDHGMYERYREVQLLALRAELSDRAASPQKKQAILDAIQQTYPHYAWIGATDRQGKVLTATNGLLVDVDVSKRPWFTNAWSGINIGDYHEAKLLAQKLPNPNGEPLRFVDVAFPYSKANGDVAGILGVHLSWQWAREVERSVIETASRHNKIDSLIVGVDGTVLLGPNELEGKQLDMPSLKAAQSGSNHFSVERWADGKTYLVGYSKSRGYRSYPGLGWMVLVRQDIGEAYAGVRQIQHRVLMSGIVVAVLFSLLGVLVARRITRPVVDLANAAQKIRKGESSTLVVPQRSYREIDELSQSIVALINNLKRNETELKDLNASLETRVAQRTAELAASEQRLRMVADNMPALIAYVDADKRYQFCNQTYLPWFGMTPDQVVGRSLEEVVGADFYEYVQPFVDLALSGQPVTFDFARQHKGTSQHLKITYTPDVSEDGVHGFYVLAQDVTELVSMQQSLQHKLLHDPLTKLPNRYACMNQLEQAIARANRTGNCLGVLFLDLDRFKPINDTFGHEVGDHVLTAFGARLRSCMRESDTVARLGGDEFVIIAENLMQGADDARVVADKVLQALRQPLQAGEHSFTVGTSIGVGLYQRGKDNPDSLLKKADLAMYDAKHNGRTTVAFRE